MLKIGHRGACGYAPENTLASIRKALEFGVDMLEFDVRCCASGEVVVIHDATLERTTNGAGFVDKTTLTQLKMLDAGSGERIPTLIEALDLINRRCGVLIEMKDEACTAPTARIIADYVRKGWHYNQLVVVSFDHTQLVRIRTLDSNLMVGANIVAVPVDLAAFGEKCGAWSINAGHDHLPPALVRDAQARGLKVFAWTVNRPEEIEQVRTLGVDGIISNFPDRLAW